MGTRYKWAGEPGELTRGDKGERIEVVHRLRWYSEANKYVEEASGTEFGVWDSTFGWIIVRPEQVGEVVS